jgi:uncharacterized protein with PQ loop repeat
MARAWQRFTLSWQSKHCNSEEGQMVHDPANVLAAQSPLDTKLRGLLGGMSVFTMIMTVPQVLAIWVNHQAAGVSILSWSAYLASAVLWLWFGIRRHDSNIYLPCLGWIALDGAVIAGAVVYG